MNNYFRGETFETGTGSTRSLTYSAENGSQLATDLKVSKSGVVTIHFHQYDGSESDVRGNILDTPNNKLDYIATLLCSDMEISSDPYDQEDEDYVKDVLYENSELYDLLDEIKFLYPAVKDFKFKLNSNPDYPLGYVEKTHRLTGSSKNYSSIIFNKGCAIHFPKTQKKG